MDILPWWSVPAVVGGWALVVFALERCFPRRRQRHRLLPRLARNLCLAGLAGGVSYGLVQPAAAWAMDCARVDCVGLLQWTAWPRWIEWPLGLLAMDLAFYYWHRLNHALPLLWRFHTVHHADGDLDASTAFRFHAGEIAASAGFRVVQVLVLGLDPALYLLYELLLVGSSIAHHANLSLGDRGERLVGWLVVTPDMHAVHHSRRRDEAFSNYGVLVPWWDRLHGSWRRNPQPRDLAMGLPGYSAAEDERLRAILSAPFAPQRDCWSESQPRGPAASTVWGRPSA